jgi:hypothetical protein
MTWQIDSFILDDRVKLFYTASASTLNSKLKHGNQKVWLLK